MSKVATHPQAPQRSAAPASARAASPRSPHAAGHLAMQPLDPLAAMAGYLRSGAAGEALGAVDRPPYAAAGGPDLPGALLHRGPAADAILGGLGARGASAGAHLFLRSSLGGATRESVLRHERAHAAQAGARMPDLGRPLRLGAPHSALERQADDAASGRAGGDAPLHADPNLVQLDRCPTGGCHTANDEFPKLRLEDWKPLEFVGKGVKVKSPQEELAPQPRSIEKELEGYEQNILATRTGIFDKLDKDRAAVPAHPFTLGAMRYGTERLPVEGTLPPDLKQRYGAALAAASVLEVAIDAATPAPILDVRLADPAALPAGAVPIEAAEDARLAINAYYLSLQEFAAAVETAQLARDARMRAAKEEEARLQGLQNDPCPTCHSQFEPPRSWLPDPPPLSPVPEQLAKALPEQIAALKTAEGLAQWKQVTVDLKASNEAMDALLIAVLPEFSEEADTLTYLKTQKASLEKLQEEHPSAVPIPAVFYPKNRWTTVDVPDAAGYTVQIPQAIPWRFYLYHSSEHSGNTAEPGTWTLVDMTAPKAPPVTEPTSNAGDVERGPTKALFEPLNTKYRFPEGKLHWTYPDGSPGELETTEPAEVSDWLGYIGLALAAIALIAGTVLTLGAAAPATVPALGLIAAAAGIGAAGFGIASTVTGMQEKERYGLLTDEDKDRAVLSIALDIIGALSLGLGRLAVAAEAGVRAAQLGTKVSTFSRAMALLNGRYFFMVTRSANVMKGVGLAADATQLLTTTADFIKAFNAIRAQPGLSDADRDAALVKLVSTSLLTGTLLTISVRSTVKEMSGVVRMTGVDPDGTIVVSPEGSAPHAKPGAPELPAPRTLQSHLETGVENVAPGWSRKAKGPQVDPALPEGRVEVRIVHDESGRIVDAETFHHAGADADSVAIHEEIATLVRTEGEALRGLVHQQRSTFGGEPPPLELQLELKKLFDEMAAAEKKLASGALTKRQADDVAQKLKLLRHEIDIAELAMADPSLRSAYPKGVVGVPVKPTVLPKKGAGGELVSPPGYPDPPAGHMYYLRDDGKFGIRPKEGYTGAARFDLEDVEGRFVASNRAHVDSEYGGRELTPARQAELEAMGYVFQKNGVIRRPPGHSAAGRPRMAPLEIDAHGRIQVVEGTESLGEMQARLRETVAKGGEIEKLEALELTAAAAGKKVVLVEGVFDTGVTWKRILTPARQAQLRDILKKEGMAAADIDRLVDGLTSKTGTLKVVFGTDPVRGAAPYGKLFSGAHVKPAGKIEVHHGDPLYLGGGHDPALLFGLPSKPHDALHAFFDNLTLPSSSPIGAVRLQPAVIQNKAKSLAKPAAAVVDPKTGDVEYQTFAR